MPVTPSARSVPVLRAAVLALKAVGRDTRADIARETRETMNPEWREAVATHADGSRMANRVFGKGARVAAGNPARLVAASSRRPLRKGPGGFIPNELGRALEFGGYDGSRTSTYTRRRRGGKSHSVTRRTLTGWPKPVRGGRVVYPAVAEMMPRFTSLWVQIIVRNINKSLEG